MPPARVVCAVWTLIAVPCLGIWLVSIVLKAERGLTGFVLGRNVGRPAYVSGAVTESVMAKRTVRRAPATVALASAIVVNHKTVLGAMTRPVSNVYVLWMNTVAVLRGTQPASMRLMPIVAPVVSARKEQESVHAVKSNLERVVTICSAKPACAHWIHFVVPSPGILRVWNVRVTVLGSMICVWKPRARWSVAANPVATVFVMRPTVKIVNRVRQTAENVRSYVRRPI